MAGIVPVAAVRAGAIAPASDAYEDDDSPAQAVPITVGAPQQHTIHELADQDWVVLDVEAGTAYSVRAGISGETVEPTVVLYASDGTTMLTWGTSVAVCYADTTGQVLARISSTCVGSYHLYASIYAPADAYEDDDSALSATPTSVGIFQDHTIHAPDDEDWFVFSAVSGGAYTIDASGKTELEVYASDGVTLVASDDDRGTYPGSQLTWTAGSTDPLYVRVTGDSSLTGSYRLTVSAVTADEYEDDDTVGSATPTGVYDDGQTHTLHDPADEDWFLLDVSTGIEYLFDATGPSGVNTTLEVYAADGVTLLASESDPLESIIAYTAASTGPLHLRVASTPTALGPYVLSVVPDQRDEYESDGEPAQAGPIVVDAPAQHRTLHSPLDEDWMVIDGQCGVRYTVELADNYGLTLDAELWLYAADAVTLLEVDSYEGLGEDDTVRRVVCSPAADGPLYARVTSRMAFGDYFIRVTSMPSDAYEPDNTSGDASPIAVGAPPQDHTIDWSGDEDWVVFNAVAGQGYAVYPQAADLYQADGTTEIAHGATPSFVAVSDGPVYARVAGGDIRAYGFGVYQVDADAYEDDDVALAASPITVDGSAQTHTIHVTDDQDWVVFDSVPGTAYALVTAAGDGAPMDTALGLYASDGTTLLHSDDDSGEDLYSAIAYTASAAGPLYARVTGDNTLGSYQLSISTVTGDAYEPDNTYSDATAIECNGGSQDHTINSYNDEDWLVFDAVAGTTYAATVTPALGLYTQVRFYAADGTTYVAGGTTRATYLADVTGSLYVRVYGMFQSTGAYAVALTGRVIAADSYEPDDSSAEYSSIAVGDAPQDRSIHIDNDQDWVRFDAVADVEYVVETSAGDGMDTQLYLFAADGETDLAWDDDSGDGAYSKLTYAPAVSGPLYAVVVGTTPGTYRLSVTEVGSPAPVAVADAFETVHDTQLVVSAPGVLENDQDNAGGGIVAELYTGGGDEGGGPSHGAVLLLSDGSFTYTPDAGFVGVDSFSYQARSLADDQLSAVVSVTITVTGESEPENRAPSANDDSYSAYGGRALAIEAPGVLGNDADPDADALSVSVVTEPGHGTLDLQADGSFTYTPAVGYEGLDSFTYQATDGALTDDATAWFSVSTWVTLSGRLVDSAGTGVGGISVNLYSRTRGGDPYPIGWGDWIDNDGDGIIDEDDERQLLETITTESDGTFGWAPFSYDEWGDPETEPALNFVDPAGVYGYYTYYLELPEMLPGDNLLGDITLSGGNTAPVADAGGPYSGAEGVAIQLDGSASHDPDAPADSITEYRWDLDSDGLFDDASGETPEVVFPDDGVFEVALRVTDESGQIDEDTATATVSNGAPDVGGFDPGSDPFEGHVVSIETTFTDPGAGDTHVASIDWGDGTPSAPMDVAEPSGAAGSVEATHAYADDGAFTVTVTVQDDDGGTGTEAVAVTVQNASPAIAPEPDCTVDEGNIVELQADFADSGALDTHTGTVDWGDGSVVEPVEITEPAGLTPGALGAAHVYGDNGEHTVTVTVEDDDGGTTSDSFTVTVTNVAPSLGPISVSDASPDVGQQVTFSVDFEDPGFEDVHTATWDWGDASTTPGVVAESDGDGTVSGSHTYASPGIFNPSCTVTDSDGDEHTVEVAVVVSVPNTAPVAVADAYSTPEDTPLVVGTADSVLDNDSDVDHDPISAVKVTDPARGTLNLDADGSFTYTPDADWNGTDSFTYKANDGTADSNTVTVSITVTPVDDPEPLPPVIEIAGDDRFTTAVEASLEAYPEGLDPAGDKTVVIATGRNWPDALGGSALAGALDGPLLLTEPGSLPSAVATEIDRLGAEKAIILGGEAAVAPEVETALEGLLGAGSVDRIAGDNRYQTADAVALRTIDLLGTGYDGTAFVATGGNFPDALGASPLAAANGWPLLLAHPTSGLSAGTVAAMADVDEVLILGGTGAVSTAVETYLVGTYGDPSVTRLAGDDRYETAADVAAYGVDEGGLGWNRVAIATGTNFPDALAGGVLQGKVGSVMLLTRPTALDPYTQTALSANKADITTVTFFGGTGALPQLVRDAVLAALE